MLLRNLNDFLKVPCYTFYFLSQERWPSVVDTRPQAERFMVLIRTVRSCQEIIRISWIGRQEHVVGTSDCCHHLLKSWFESCCLQFLQAYPTAPLLTYANKKQLLLLAAIFLTIQVRALHGHQPFSSLIGACSFARCILHFKRLHEIKRKRSRIGKNKHLSAGSDKQLRLVMQWIGPMEFRSTGFGDSCCTSIMLR